MATTIQFKVCQSSNCSSIIFNDITGAYSLGDNPSGYGPPNSVIDGATAQLIITLSNGAEHTIPALTSPPVFMAGFPTTDKTKEFIITSEALGYTPGSKIDDQIITIKYQVTLANNTVLTQIFQEALYCQVNCCVSSMFKDIDVNCIDCMNTKSDTTKQAWIMLQGLKHSAGCSDVKTFNSTLSALKKLCSASGCSNCK